MILRKGQVYKITFDRISTLRNYMIMCPSEDINIDRFKKKHIQTYIPIFHINLAGEFNHYCPMGIDRAIKFERPTLIDDIREVVCICSRYGLKYNEQLNRVEGYDTRER